MKIGDNLYECGCGNIIEIDIQKIPNNEGKKDKRGSMKRKLNSGMVKCLKCGNYISQKTLTELKLKYGGVE